MLKSKTGPMTQEVNHNSNLPEWVIKRRNIEDIAFAKIEKKVSGIKKYLRRQINRLLLPKQTLIVGQSGSGKSVFTLTKLLPEYFLVSNVVCYVGFKSEFNNHVQPFMNKYQGLIKSEAKLELFDIDQLNNNPVEAFNRMSGLIKDREENSVIVLDGAGFSPGLRDIAINMIKQFNYQIIVSQGVYQGKLEDLFPVEYFGKIWAHIPNTHPGIFKPTLQLLK